MKPRRFILVLVVLIGAVLACNMPIGQSSPGGLLPSETVAPPFSPESTASPTLPQAPTATPLLPTDSLPTPTNMPKAKPGLYFPSGFMTYTEDASSVILYDLQGELIKQLDTPGISGSTFSNLHLGGRVWEGALNGPLVFTSFEDQGKIKQNQNGQISDLIPGPDIINLNGAMGENIFVYNKVWMANETLVTQLYLYDQASAAILVQEWFDPDFSTLFPMGIDLSGNTPQAIWYTYQPWGIGGDIVFPPYEGLLYLDLETRREDLILALGYNPVGLSPDKSLVAYVPVSLGYLNEPDPAIRFYDLSSQVITEILLLPGSERGAGYTVFSPENHYAAWMEASGWQMAEVPNFTTRVRIADTNGNLLADLPVNNLASITNVANPTWARPAGWLDAETLVVEILGDDWNNPALVKVRYDGSGLSYLASGRFAGFVYP